ncbi:unnamed protein product [Dicrocoelium dendriticum]|nr:unnamed protein product [Dicrocoelium dendriticum]
MELAVPRIPVLKSLFRYHLESYAPKSGCVCTLCQQFLTKRKVHPMAGLKGNCLNYDPQKESGSNFARVQPAGESQCCCSNDKRSAGIGPPNYSIHPNMLASTKPSKVDYVQRTNPSFESRLVCTSV